MNNFYTGFEIIKMEQNKRSNFDRRKKIDYYLVSYYEKDGEHRKSFEFKINSDYDTNIETIRKNLINLHKN